MATKRTEIRNAVVDALKTIDAFNGRVFPGRRRTLAQYDLPAACVYVEGEEKELLSMDKPRKLDRELTLIYEIFIPTAPVADYDLLDTLCKAAEDALLEDETLGGLVSYVFPESDKYEISEEGDYAGAYSQSRAVISYIE